MSIFVGWTELPHSGESSGSVKHTKRRLTQSHIFGHNFKSFEVWVLASTKAVARVELQVWWHGIMSG